MTKNIQDRKHAALYKNERTDDWRTIFGDLTDDGGCYEIAEVNIYQLTSHLEELYLRIAELEEKLNE